MQCHDSRVLLSAFMLDNSNLPKRGRRGTQEVSLYYLICSVVKEMFSGRNNVTDLEKR